MLALGSAFFSAAAAIAEKKVLFKERALSFSVVLALFNLILVVPFFFFIDFSVLTFPGLAVLFFKSVLGALAFLCVMLGIKNLEISKALPLLVLTPGLVALGAFIFLGEALSLFEIGGMVLLLVGTYVLQLGRRKDFLGPWKSFIGSKGNQYIVYALVLFTVTSILDKAILKNFKVPVNAFIGFQHLFFAIVFVFLVVSSGGARDVKRSFKFSWGWILLISLFTITYRYTQISAVKIAPVALVLSLKRVSVFFAVVIGGRIFSDHNLFVRAVATAMMVCGAVMVIVG